MFIAPKYIYIIIFPLKNHTTLFLSLVEKNPEKGDHSKVEVREAQSSSPRRHKRRQDDDIINSINFLFEL